MTTAQLKRAAREMGATVEDDSSGRWQVYQVCAPVGFYWTGLPGTHMLRAAWMTGTPGTPAYRREVITDALSVMQHGLTPCEDTECDYCHSDLP